MVLQFLRCSSCKTKIRRMHTHTSRALAFRRCAVALTLGLAALLFACGSVDPTANTARPRKSLTPQTPGTKTNNLPPPRTRVSLQTKYTKAIPMNGSEPAYEVVEQWVFQPDGDKDQALICVEDDLHCIPVLKLKEQLNRPSNDPLGIR